MYPKYFFAQNGLAVKPGTCFLAMPFGRAFDQIHKSIKRVLENELGLHCTRTDELPGGGDIIEDILRGIAQSEVIVVDVTGRNPNVYYELGIAHMCKPMENVILLSQDVQAIPFDLRSFRHIVYAASPQGFKMLARGLRESVGAVTQKVQRIFLDEHHKGALPDKLIGSDHCLYGFEVPQGILGYDAAKFQLVVTKYAISTRREESVVFNDGMGLSIGNVQRIGNLEWTIGLELAPDNRHCLRIQRLPSGTAG